MLTDHWDLVNHKQDLITLLKMIRNMVHQHNKIKGGEMHVVEQDIRLYVYDYQKAASITSELPQTLQGTSQGD